MQAGEKVLVQGFKADGTLYRWWWATVESAAADEVVTVTPPGHRVEDPAGGWTSRYAIRDYYWPDKWYSLLEVFLPDGNPPQGDLVEIYLNINSPVEIEEGRIRFTDYELDVSREVPKPGRIVDEDEFQEAAARYGYSEEFQRFCYQVAREAVEIADRWQAGEMPIFGDREE